MENKKGIPLNKQTGAYVKAIYENKLRQKEKQYRDLRRTTNAIIKKLTRQVNHLDLCLQKSQLACRAIIKADRGVNKLKLWNDIASQ